MSLGYKQKKMKKILLQDLFNGKIKFLNPLDFITRFKTFDDRSRIQLEKGLQQLKEANSISGYYVNTRPYFTTIIFNVRSSKSEHPYEVVLPYINGIEKLDQCNGITFNLTDLLMGLLDLEQLNEIVSIIPDKTYSEIQDKLDEEAKEELFGDPALEQIENEAIYSEFIGIEGYEEESDQFFY